MLKILLFVLVGLPLAQLVHAQAIRSGTDPGRALYRDANTPAAATHFRTELKQQPHDFLNKGDYEVGYLYLLTGRRVLVPGLRYHVGQRVVQVQDSMQVDSTHYWPLAALRGFDLGSEDEPATLRRYRPRLVHDGRQGDHREAVQVLTATDAGPLLLGWLPVATSNPTTGLSEANTSLTAPQGSIPVTLVAGPGNDPTQPLRPLELSEAGVLHLCGSRSEQVKAFARTKNLHFNLPAEVAQLFDYYNRIAVAKMQE